MRLSADRLPLIAALVTVCLWASAFVGIRSAGHELSPGPLALARLLVAVVALGLLVGVRREPLAARPAWGGIVVSGVLWLGAYNVSLNAAERHVDAGTASLLVNIAPVFIAIIAGRALRQGVARFVLAGCAVAFAGVALIAVGTSRHGISAGGGAGLCLLAAAVYAVGVVAQKPALRHASPLAVTWLACCVGAVCCLPYAPSLLSELRHVHGGALAWTIYLGIVPTAIGFSTWAYALSHTDVARLGATTYLVPPIAVLLGWLALGEVPPLIALPGGILCLAGVALSRVSPGRFTRAGGSAGPAGPAGEQRAAIERV